MAFADEVKIVTKAGNGGNGLVSFRRERYVAKGGPDGGNGGNGGNIYLIANHNETNLAKFLRHRHITASAGQSGKSKKMAGKAGNDLEIKVPVGTQVISFKEKQRGKQEEYIIADLDKPDEKFLLAKGGTGGFGNAHFARASFQTPRFADLGEPGEEREIILRLKMVAEVGIIGLPSAGKSTLLSVISNAKPKIAEYAFTTLIPNLGIVNFADYRFLAADIPGLIKGAHRGKGLGINFLKHIERTKILIHVIDATSTTIKKDFNTINSELKKYSSKLAQKPQIVVLNKMDVIDNKTLAGIKRYKFNNWPIHYISAVTHQGLKNLLYDVVVTLKKIPNPSRRIKIYTIADLPMNQFEVSKKGKQFLVKGDRVERLVQKTDLNHPQALGRLYKILKRIGVLSELKKNGAQDNDIIKIGKHTIEYKEI